MLLRLVPCAPDTNLRFANRRFGNPLFLVPESFVKVLSNRRFQAMRPMRERPGSELKCPIENLAHRNRSDFCDLRLRCPSRTPEIARFPKQEKAMSHCDLRVRWKVASDLRFRAAISEPQTPSFCGISGDLAQSTRKSLAIAIVRFWCAKIENDFFRRGCSQSELQVTNFFSCSDGCSEGFGDTNFRQLIENLPPPRFSLPKFPNFITLNFWDRSRVMIFQTSPKDPSVLKVLRRSNQ